MTIADAIAHSIPLTAACRVAALAVTLAIAIPAALAIWREIGRHLDASARAMYDATDYDWRWDDAPPSGKGDI